ncbi:MAG: L-threonylcarbamoyladenylate synthase [Defluviitaleaceae bacterium]|nr:L-threonylcarbamoyladenylate synthase [Defluviitaleaceae bacterium]
MNTSVLRISGELTAADRELIGQAALCIRAGGLVAFPTETVYGLGANGFDPAACAKIYTAKGRPSDNPLILHIVDMAQLGGVAAGLNPHGQALAASFWPGPLTLVTQRSEGVDDIVSGGLNTVAVRMPSDPVARELLRAAGVPVAAPSANVSGSPSSTRAEHVAADLSGKIDMIVDGGMSALGLESTIVDVSGDVPCLLRPGSITVADLEAVVGRVDIDPAVHALALSGARPKAPGMAYVHYAPKAELTIVYGAAEASRRKIDEAVRERRRQDAAAVVGVVTTDEHIRYYEDTPARIFSLGKGSDPAEAAVNLYDVLRELDRHGITHAYAEAYSEEGLGLAVMNRLKKAAGYRKL